MDLGNDIKLEELEKWKREIKAASEQADREVRIIEEEIARLELRQTVLADTIEFCKMRQQNPIVEKLQNELNNINKLILSKQPDVVRLNNNKQYVDTFTETLISVIDQKIKTQFK